MKIEISLSQKSVNHAIGQIKAYRDSLGEKNETFVYELLKVGIKVAQENAGGFGKYITFSKKGKSGKYTTIGYLIGKDEQPIIAEWDYKGDKKTAVISPILMAEFGSAGYAEVLFDDVSGVGQGTFPGQTHAFESFWWYKEWDENGKGEWKRGFGIRPTHPMYHAEMQMYAQVYDIARKVFNTDGR